MIPEEGEQIEKIFFGRQNTARHTQIMAAVFDDGAGGGALYRLFLSADVRGRFGI